MIIKNITLSLHYSHARPVTNQPEKENPITLNLNNMELEIKLPI